MINRGVISPNEGTIMPIMHESNNKSPKYRWMNRIMVPAGLLFYEIPGFRFITRYKMNYIHTGHVILYIERE